MIYCYVKTASLSTKTLRDWKRERTGILWWEDEIAFSCWLRLGNSVEFRNSSLQGVKFCPSSEIQHMKPLQIRGELVGFLVLFGMLAVPLPGATPNANREQAVRLVEQAVQAEIDGDFLGRERFLAKAQHLEPDFAPVRWYQGQVVGMDGQWLSVDEAVDQAASNKLLADYEAYRAKQQASIAGNWQAASWCAKNALGSQCRAHLMNILMFDADHVGARQALGHQLLGGDWISPEDQRRFGKRAMFTKTGFAKYQSTVTKLLDKTNHPNPNVQEAGWEQLNSIDDPLVIPVLEAVAARYGHKTHLFVANKLGTMKHQEAAHALARLALSAPSAEVTQAAVDNLKKQSLFDFVPDMLAAMSSPIQFMSVPVLNEYGKLAGFRQAFAKEGMHERELFTLDSVIRYHHPPKNRLPGPGATLIGQLYDSSAPLGSKITRIYADPFRQGESLENLMAEGAAAVAARIAVMESRAIALAQNRAMAAVNENRVVAERNARIAKVISRVTNQEFQSVPSDVWQWWDRYNETEYQRSKLTQRRYQRNNYDVPLSLENTGVTILKSSCFVAGTPVVTLRGLRPIEQLLPGDMVLSRSIETGELSYKPVVAATTRAPAKTVLLKVDDETIHATTSHLLWVSGKGWTKAGEIQPGELLHAAAEPAVVMSTTPGAILPTHNLVVADNHTYFVGASRVLSHDVLPRGSAHELVPGQFMLTMGR